MTAVKNFANAVEETAALLALPKNKTEQEKVEFLHVTEGALIAAKYVDNGDNINTKGN